MIISNAFLWVINESFQRFFTLSEDNVRVLGSAKLAVVIFIYYGNAMLFFGISIMDIQYSYQCTMKVLRLCCCTAGS